ncbi:hypothetical protein [Streptomyces sp. MI02-7b]|uniref:hypothetical protein n=1 Tax=Streptomyces sp. MI02-7b TaxID=462941 RepID=UPI0029AD76B6|nr:hypothetical protein [Streptomyces sp. MI02-7b]MDX3075760.1 hypothetical protein [Streptomyces sp. MI02-7b]
MPDERRSRDPGAEANGKPATPPNPPQPSRVRLPGFVTDDDIGLGDVAKRVTGAAGIRPCRKCERRAAALNRWLVFSGRSNRWR